MRAQLLPGNGQRKDRKGMQMKKGTIKKNQCMLNSMNLVEAARDAADRQKTRRQRMLGGAAAKYAGALAGAYALGKKERASRPWAPGGTMFA